MKSKYYWIGVLSFVVIMSSIAIFTDSVVLTAIASSIYVAVTIVAVTQIIVKERHRKALEFQKNQRDQQIFNRIYNCIFVKKKFLDGDFSLDELSNLIGVNKAQASIVLNKYSGMNFKQYLNKFRVEYALNELKKCNAKLTMRSLCYDSGFNSINSFNSAFRKFVGRRPSSLKEEFINEKIGQTSILQPVLTCS